MANYTTNADLINAALFAAGEPIDGTSDFDSAALRYLNRAYQSIWSGGSELVPNMTEVWWWLQKNPHGVLILDPRIEDGSVSVTNNSTSITFSVAPTPSVANRYLLIVGHPDVFQISAHVAGATDATLDAVYTGTTSAAASYYVVKLDYDLASDFMHLGGPMQGSRKFDREIELVGINQLHRMWPMKNVQSGQPEAFAFLDTNTIRFSHYGGTSSTDLIRIDYPYIMEPSDLADDANECLVPRQFRKILADWVTAMLLEDKVDGRAADFFTSAQNGLVSMAKKQKKYLSRPGGDRFGSIRPRLSGWPRTKYLKTASGVLLK